ncbi:MAG: hypothetical protein RLZZ466_798 [Bacteroidota bacterium]|jgi:hypothetical protein
MRYLIILTLFCWGLLQTTLAQPPLGDRIPEKMNLFIQKRMRLTEREREAFGPVYAKYQKEFQQTLRKNREDRLLSRQQIIELQIRYRKEFAPIVGEGRVLQIYDLQEDFIRTLREIQSERMKNRKGPGRMGPPPPPRDF